MYFVEKVLYYCNVSVKKCKELRIEKLGYYDLTFVLKGSLTYLINGQKYVLYENDAMLLPPDTLRERPSGNATVKYVSFNFQLFSDFTVDKKIFMRNIISPEIRALMSAYPYNYLSSKYHSREKAVNIINYILLDLIDTKELNVTNTNIKKIIKFIDENITDTLTLSAISEHVKLSKEYVSYLFKKEVNKSVITYVNERKMLMAKFMIRAGEMRLCDISSNLGYENYSYFSRLFKKQFKITPIQFKNLCDNNK